MSDDISLYNLVNLSIGTPEDGVVNFTALHTLLHAILGHLNIQNVTAKWEKKEDFLPQVPHCRPQTESSTEERLRRVETQISVMEKLPSGTELLQRTSSSGAPVNHMWQMMQVQRRIQTNEDGVSKSMALIQDLLKEIRDLQEFGHSLKTEVKGLQAQLEKMNAGDLAERVTAVETCCHRVEELQAATRSLKERVVRYPDPEELDKMVTWDVMQSILLSEREYLEKAITLNISPPPGASVPCETSVSPSTSPPRTSSPPSTPSSPTIPGKPVTSPRQSTPDKPSTPPAPSAPHSTDPGAAVPAVARQREDAPADQVEAPPARLSTPPQRGPSETGSAAVGTPPARLASGAERYPETLEALKNIGKLRERHDSLEAHVKTLQAVKVDQAQLAQLKEHITNRGGRDLPDDLMDQLNQLRALVDSLMSGREKNVELINDVQKAILQLQSECEKLHNTTRHLVEDHSQKQSHIQQLFKSMQELEENKADKQLVEMEIEIKADKCALDSKVSRVQFDAMTEQLNTMFHELLTKVTDQEEDWHKVIDRLSTEMESKLNRIELDSVKKQLEHRWKNICKKLQAQPAPEQEDAAGIRRQLVARFHCISCDRPVDMHPSGPHVVTVPSAPGLPSHKSSRPYTVYELEQVRQHCRRLNPGTNRCKYVAHSDRSMSMRRRTHTMTCRQVERVQSRAEPPRADTQPGIHPFPPPNPPEPSTEDQPVDPGSESGPDRTGQDRTERAYRGFNLEQLELSVINNLSMI